MSTLEIRGSAIHTQCLLSKAITKNKITTSDLLKCLKNIQNLPAENYNSKNNVYLKHINQILDGQNSKVLNKKREILNKISMLTAPERGNPCASSDTIKRPPSVSSSGWSETVSYDSVFTQSDNISSNSNSRPCGFDSSYAHPVFLKEKPESTENQFYSELKAACEKRQKKNASPTDASVNSSREKLNTINKTPRTELESAFARVLRKPVKAESQSIAKHADNIPVYATVQKLPPLPPLDTMQADIKVVIHSIDRLFDHCNTKNEKNICCALNIVAGDINNVLDKLNSKNPLSSSARQEAKKITNDCLKEMHTLSDKIYALGDSGLIMNSVSNTIKSMALATQKRLNL